METLERQAIDAKTWSSVEGNFQFARWACLKSLKVIALRLSCKPQFRWCARDHHRCSALPAPFKIDAYEKARG